MKKTTKGISYRINNQNIIVKKAVLCVFENETMDICGYFQQSFLGLFPFSYIGATAWPSVKVNEKCLSFNDSAFIEFNEILLSQVDFGVVVFCIKSDKYTKEELNRYIEYFSNVLPDAKTLCVDFDSNNTFAKIAKEKDMELISNNKAEEIISLCKEYIEKAGKPSFYETQNREGAEWNNYSFVESIIDGNNRVLLVGDSICFGYCNYVRDLLKNYNIDVFTTSEGTAHNNIYRLLKIALEWFDYKVIHINIGIHIHNVSIQEYEQNLTGIFNYIKKLSPKTKIIFATTTTASKKAEETGEKGQDRNFSLGHRQPATETEALFTIYDENASQMYLELNNIANKVCKRNSVEIDDLFGICIKNNPVKTDKVHFTNEGYKLLAESVAKSITLNMF